MNRESPFRIFLNLVLIAIVLISVVATGFVSVKEYRFNRIPEIYSDKQIIKLVKEKYPDFGFDKNDNWTIETNLAEDRKSFTADVDIAHERDLYTAHYGVQLTFALTKGSWKKEEVPNEIVLVNNEWHVENSEWVKTTNDGTKYEISFFQDSEVRLTIQGSSTSTPEEESSVNVLEDAAKEEDVDEDMEDDNPDEEGIYTNESSEGEDVYDNGSDSDVINVKDFNEILMCQLSESEDGTSLTGTFDAANKTILLIITGDSVKLEFDRDGEGIILEKK